MVRAANERSNSFRLGIATCIGLGIFLIYSGFGVLAFALAIFVGIFGFGLRDKFSNETTASAYSVFNQDGRAIVGGFTAGQFEQQLRGVGGSTLGNNDDPVKGSIAKARMAASSKSIKLTEEERTIRRRDAAAAAERRLRANAAAKED